MIITDEDDCSVSYLCNKTEQRNMAQNVNWFEI